MDLKLELQLLSVVWTIVLKAVIFLISARNCIGRGKGRTTGHHTVNVSHVRVKERINNVTFMVHKSTFGIVFKALFLHGYFCAMKNAVKED